MAQTLLEEIEEKPLSIPEQHRLAELESVIDENLKAFFKVGAALTEIRDSRLYRTEFKTWDEYLREVWDMPKQRAFQLTSAFGVVSNLQVKLSSSQDEKSTIVDFLPGDEKLPMGNILPVNEGQVRPLTYLTPEEQPVVWLFVIKVSKKEGIKITGALVNRCVEEHKGKALRDEVKKGSRGPNKKYKISDEMEESFQKYIEAMQKEIDSSWRNTSKKAVIDQLRSLLAAAEEL